MSKEVNSESKKDNLNKSTYDITLWQPILKSNEGKYIGVLSDTSVDRDGEIVGEEALTKIMEDDGITIGLLDHENKILNQVCVWENKRLEKIDGHTALVAEPKFFESNPNATIVKNMLDEGAKMGVSIGAIVLDKKEEKIMDKTVTIYTDLEILEASFVAIPSNRHGQAMLAMAKSFKTKLEEKRMSDKKKDYDDVISENENLKKELEKTKSDLDKLRKENEEPTPPADPPADPPTDPPEGEGEDKAEADKKYKALEKKFKEQEAEIEKMKRSPHYKTDPVNIDNKTMSDTELEKKYKAGELPVMRT